MDILAVITELITSVGFPIAACIFLAWNNTKLQTTMAELNITLSVMNERLDKIEDSINKNNN